ncbi:MAG: hypothetical protein LBM96_00165 [Methanobrevibacter sp.]|jgi:hypothetical protein|nr:hypothetical protein [Candidatus Methanoflexus mossambicus]
MRNKMIKKIFSMILIVSAMMIFTIGMTSASSEKITNGNGYSQITYDNKYYTIEKTNFFKENNQGGLSDPNEYYLLNLKTSMKNKYKINSAKISYYHYYSDDKIDDGEVQRETKYITIKSKDKSSIYIKAPNTSKDYYEIHSATISFTKNGKKATTNVVQPKKYTWTYNKLLTGKTAKVTINQKGYGTYGAYQDNYEITTYNKLKITTKSSKYHIKSVKLYYYDPKTFNINSFTFKGNGKTVMTIIAPHKYLQIYCLNLKLSYY